MAVDQNGIAWINYYDFSTKVGSLFRVSTTTAQCQPSGIGLPPEWAYLGMGFTADPMQPSGEKLFLASNDGKLAYVDFATQAIVTVGSFAPPFNGTSSELTGSADGRLFALINSQSPQVVEINPANASTVSVVTGPLTGQFSDFAFSYWGGAFYLYTTTTAGAGSTVQRFDPMSDTLDPSYVPNTGFPIVGAGVAPCVSTLPP